MWPLSTGARNIIIETSVFVWKFGFPYATIRFTEETHAFSHEAENISHHLIDSSKVPHIS